MKHEAFIGGGQAVRRAEIYALTTVVALLILGAGIIAILR